jgi:hypothetical protein
VFVFTNREDRRDPEFTYLRCQIIGVIDYVKKQIFTKQPEGNRVFTHIETISSTCYICSINYKSRKNRDMLEKNSKLTKSYKRKGKKIINVS